MDLSLPKVRSVYLASVCRSLQCLISALTQGGEGDLLFRLTSPVLLWGLGGGTGDKHHWRVWGVLTQSQPHWVPPLTACVLSASMLLRLQVALQGADSRLHPLPRSKLLRFRFSGTPQRCRLSWTCVCVLP